MKIIATCAYIIKHILFASETKELRIKSKGP